MIRDSGSSYLMASESEPLVRVRRSLTDGGRDYELTGSEEGKEVLITASDSLEDRYDPNVCPLLFDV